MALGSGKITGFGRNPGSEYVVTSHVWNQYDIQKSAAGQNNFLSLEGNRAPWSWNEVLSACAISPDGNYFAFVTIEWPSLRVYRKVNGAWELLPTSNFNTLPINSANTVEFGPDSASLWVGVAASPFIYVYSISGNTFTLDSAANFSPGPGGAVRSISFNSAGTSVAFATGTSPFFKVYNISGKSYTLLTLPSGLPTNTGMDVSWAPDGNSLALIGFSSPVLVVLTRSGDTFTVKTGITSPAGSGQSGNYNNDGTYLTVTFRNSPYMYVYGIIGGTYTVLRDPATKPTGAATNCEWSTATNTLYVGTNESGVSTGQLLTYSVTGTSTTYVGRTPIGSVGGMSICPATSSLLVQHSISPGVNEFTYSGTTLTDNNIFNRTTTTNILPVLYNNSQAWAGISVAPNGEYLTATFATTPFFQVTKINSDTSFTLLTNSTGAGPSGVDYSSWSKDSAYTAITGPNGIWLKILQVSGTTLTAVTLSANAVGDSNGSNWNTYNSSRNLLIGSSVSPYFTEYTVSGTTATRVTGQTLTAAINGTVQDIDTTNNGATIAMALNTSPFINVYTRTGTPGTWTKAANPTTLPPGAGRVIAWSNNGKFVAIGCVGTPFMRVYSWNGTALTALSNPAVNPGTTVSGITWSFDDSRLYVITQNQQTGNGAEAQYPYQMIYELNGTQLRLISKIRSFDFTSSGASGTFAPKSMGYFYKQD